MPKQTEEAVRPDDTQIPGRANQGAASDERVNEWSRVPAAKELPPYEELLAYHRGEWCDPLALQRLEAQLDASPRLRAHLESIRYLDLERAAAVQDAADLSRFDASQASDLCKEVAFDGGAMFEMSARNPGSVSPELRTKWAKHTKTCVFCRRMRRRAITKHEATVAGVPPGEPLLVDWLLSHHYDKALETVAESIRILSNLPPDLRDIFGRHFFQGVPLEQIAAERNVSVDEVKRLMKEARTKCNR